MYQAPVTGQHFLLSQVSLYQTSITATIMTTSTMSSTSTASQPESGVGDSGQDTERTSATHGSLTIAWPDSNPIKINIGAWLGEEPITLARFDDDGGSVKVKGTSYAFPSEAVITVDRPSQITGQPPKSQDITYNSAQVKWMDKLNLVEILDQNRHYNNRPVVGQKTTYM